MRKPVSTRILIAFTVVALLVGLGVPMLAAAQGTLPTWTQVTSPLTVPVAFNGLSMVSMENGWIVGDSGTVLKGTNGAWTDSTGFVTPAAPGSVTGESLNAVAVVPGSTTGEAWAVGGHAIILHTTNGQVWTQVNPTPLIDLDTGNALTKQLDSVDMVSATDGWIVGDTGTILHLVNGVWQMVPRIANVGGLHRVRMTAGTNGAEGWAVGNAGAILHYTNGAWAQVQASVPITNDLYSVQMVAPDDGWIVGAEGRILRWRNGLWVPYQSSAIPGPPLTTYYEVSMTSPTDGWAAGNGATLIHWDGTDWNLVQPYLIETNRPHFYFIEMLSQGQGWLVGANGVIFRTGTGTPPTTPPPTTPPPTTPPPTTPPPTTPPPTTPPPTTTPPPGVRVLLPLIMK